MDDKFDEAKAKAIISAFASKHGQTDGLPAGGHYVTDDFENLSITVDCEEGLTTSVYRLIVEDSDSDNDEATELTLYTVGVLAQKLFPPFKPRRQYTPHRQGLYASFTQSATIVGVGAPIMADAIDAVKAAYVELERHVPKAACFPTERINVDNFVVANPYFVVGDDAKDKTKLMFPKTVDPFDDLNRAQVDGCIHTAENEVQYMQGYEDEDGVFRQIPVAPTQFRAGDIVRVGFSAVFKKDHKLHSTSDISLVLRSITLIDKTLSTDIAIRQLTEPGQTPTKKRTTISRGKFVVDVEERPISKVRKALAKMSLASMDTDVDMPKVAQGDDNALNV